MLLITIIVFWGLGRLVFEAYHSTLGLRVTKKKKRGHAAP